MEVGKGINGMHSSKIQFIHRSVHDFLSTPQARREFQIWVDGDFNELQHLAMALAALQRLTRTRIVPGERYDGALEPLSRSKACQFPPGDLEFEDSRFPEGAIIHALEIVARAAKWNDAACIAQELDAFDRTWERQRQEHGQLELSARSGPFYVSIDGVPANSFKTSEFDGDIMKAPFIVLAAFWGLSDFVQWKLEASPETLHPIRHHSLLLSASVGALSRSVHSAYVVREEDISSLLQLPRYLLSRGASPNATLDISLYNYLGESNIAGATEGNWTVWNAFLFSSIRYICRSTASQIVPELMELYLNHGAEPNTCFIGYKLEDSTSETSSEAVEEPNPATQEIQGSYYMGLDQLIQVWSPRNKDCLVACLRKQARQSLWGIRPWSALFPPKSGAIRHLSAAELGDDRFIVVSVVGHQFLTAAQFVGPDKVDETWAKDPYELCLEL